MKILLAFVMLITAGCATLVEHNTRVTFPNQTTSNIEVRKLIGGNTNVRAYAELYADGKCIIYLRQYPQCLAHEVRHCLEGNWHEGRHTDEGC